MTQPSFDASAIAPLFGFNSFSDTLGVSAV